MVEHNVDIALIDARLAELQKRRSEIEAPIKKREEQTKKAKRVLDGIKKGTALLQRYGPALIGEITKKKP